MYPDSGYKLAHAQLVCTRPFSPTFASVCLAGPDEVFPCKVGILNIKTG